jgi:hypothetical protein
MLLPFMEQSQVFNSINYNILRGDPGNETEAKSSFDDRVGNAYSGMPDRLYVIDRDGKVAYKGGRGPFGYKPGEMEQSLVMLLLDQRPTDKP